MSIDWAAILPCGWLQGGAVRIVPAALGETEAAVARLVDPAGKSWFVKAARDAAGRALRAEFDKLRWLLERGAPVSPPLDCVERAGITVLRTLAAPGEPALTSSLPPPVIIRRMAEALRCLHALPVEGWPFGSAHEERLVAAAANMTSDPRYAGRRRRQAGIVRLAALRDHPVASGPPVIVHGDADLANFIVTADAGTFVDCGAAGLADRALDLYVAADALESRFGAAGRALFFSAYGAPANAAALAYYEALDDFF